MPLVLAPKGWRDFSLQVGLLGSFELVYALRESTRRREAAIAIGNGHGVAQFERSLGLSREHGIQNWVLHGNRFVAVVVASPADAAARIVPRPERQREESGRLGDRPLSFAMAFLSGRGVRAPGCVVVIAVVSDLSQAGAIGVGGVDVRERCR
jgi:hypothetical protein